VWDSVTVQRSDATVLAEAEARLAALRARHGRVVFDAYLGATPTVDASARLFPGAALVGDVRLGPDVSVWYGAVLRGDLRHIAVGARSNVQDGAVVHLGDLDPTEIGEDVTVGHGAVIHGATLEDGVLVGIRATVLDGAVVGAGSLIGAGAVVPSGTRIPPLSLVLGVPGKVARSLPSRTLDDHRALAAKYVRLAANHAPGAT
jgi:carbonic anhydrase/acetyltransferase-like protein (isoleucine patch superfamily)